MIPFRPCRGAYGGPDLMESGIREAIVGWDDFRNWHIAAILGCLLNGRYRGKAEVTPNLARNGVDDTLADLACALAQALRTLTVSPSKGCVPLRPGTQSRRNRRNQRHAKPADAPSTAMPSTDGQSPAMKNGRCRMHGGPSPGAPKGNRNAFKHGLYTADAIARRKEITGSVQSFSHRR
jgi:hypothetical protein